MSEISHEGLLNPTNFGRFTPSPSSGTSSKLYKRIEELMDLSSPYNHYRCLSPSENNLTQVQENKYTYSTTKLDKPGSGRLLRRQFSLDKEDGATANRQQHQQLTQNNLEILQHVELRASPTNFKIARLPKQHSASLAIDLEKIEEIPLSPTSLMSNHHRGAGDGGMLPRIPGSESGSPSSRKDDDLNGVLSEQHEINMNVDRFFIR